MKDFKFTLTEEILKNIGFTNHGKDKITNRNVWRLKVPYYHYDFQIVLNSEYPVHNGNCGVLSLYRAKEKVKGLEPKGKYAYKEVWHEFPEVCHPIAHHVCTPERLRQIIIALTQVAII